jgi:hypothetical protein
VLTVCVCAAAGGVWAAAAAASVAYSRRRAAPSPRLVHARALALAVLGGAAALASVHYRSSKADAADRMDLDFYSQLPPATDADGNENERWSW